MNESDMQHGKNWRGQTVRGWVATEKFRGARLYWDGAAAWSRGGLSVALPPTIRRALPAGRSLDCEVWARRGPAGGACEVEAARAVTRGVWSPRLRLLVFDAPDVLAPYAERLAVARTLVSSPLVAVIGDEVLVSLAHLERLFAATVRGGGEGLMLHHPAALYTPARVSTLLKVKLDPALSRGVVRDLSPRAPVRFAALSLVTSCHVLPTRGDFATKSPRLCHETSQAKPSQNRLPQSWEG